MVRSIKAWFLLLAWLPLGLAAEALDVSLSDDVEVRIHHYPAQGEHLILWLPPSFGFKQRHQHGAQQLARAGFEVWQAELLEALFLPLENSALRSLSGRYVAELIEQAHQRSGKQILLASSSYGAIPVLRGVWQWQRKQPASAYVSGAILFSPNLYAQIPELGAEAEYLPIVHASRLPVLIFQASDTSNRWHLPSLTATLEAAGSTVYSWFMPGVRSLFYPFEEPLAVEDAALARLPQRLRQVLPLLTAAPPALQAQALPAAMQQESAHLNLQLKPYRGTVQAQALSLEDTQGLTYQLHNYHGQVTVVNFWATWCPPCVEEIPSLNRLRAALADEAFELVSVNFSEDADTIRRFMEKVRVEFPVLLDPEGTVSADWRVYAFPSTFVIGPDGKIAYGVNAAIAWDSPDVLAKLRALLKSANKS